MLRPKPIMREKIAEEWLAVRSRTPVSLTPLTP
jgi:hypothetical protein